MSRLNPIYILALIGTFLIITIFMVSGKKNELNEVTSSFNTINQNGKIYNEYKNNWFDKKDVSNRIDRIIKNSMFRNEKILKSETNNLVKIKIESANQRVLSQFLNKILNEKFIIKKLELQKTYISLEIGYK